MFIRDDRVAAVQPSHGRTNQHVVDMSTQGLNMRNHCGCTLRSCGPTYRVHLAPKMDMSRAWSARYGYMPIS